VTLAGPPSLDLARRINIVQGEYRVERDPDIVLCTILGSCVAACLWDPMAAVGGMNHFLLPGQSSVRSGGGAAQRYGAYAMELLINDLLRHGARRERLKAKLFGGACLVKGLTDIGRLNAEFAERFLNAESIEIVGGSLRGERGRRIQFSPTTGRARQTLLAADQPAVLRAEPDLRTLKTPPPSGAVELF
ncbi:unnamed protein product, partial [Acidocella sp. C78]